MTLDEMARFISGKVNQTEAEDVAACKGFLQRRHDMLWNEALWKDSLVEYRQTLSPTGYTLISTWLPTKGILLLPAFIQRVLAVRSDTRKLNIQRPEYFYRIDYDAFAKTGDATDYVLLPPCVWEVEDRATIWAQKQNAADAGIVLTSDVMRNATDAGDGITVSRDSVTLAEEFTRVAGSGFERIDRLTKNASSGNITLTINDRFSQYIDLINTTDAAVQIGFSPTNNVADLTLETTIPAQGRQYIGPIDTGWFFVWDPITPAHYIEPAVGFKGSGLTFRGTITWDGTAITVASDADLVTFAAAAASLPLRQRVRFVEIPTAAMTVRVLGKRGAPLFTGDSDEPGISGSENCLISFAQGDMLQRERQYGKAQELFQEGAMLLDQLKRVETVQQAHNARIIPEGGFGDDGVSAYSKANFF